MKRLAVVFSLLIAALAPSMALADPANAVRQTITAQLDALRLEDAAAAYAYAAPSIKRLYPTPERFIAMVREGYRPVLEADRPVFLRFKAEGDKFAQEVAFSDADGRGWTALYTLARQEDGAWRITGCYLRKAGGQNI